MLRIVSAAVRAVSVRSIAANVTSFRALQPLNGIDALRNRYFCNFLSQIRSNSKTETNRCGMLLSEPLMKNLLPVEQQSVRVPVRTLTKFSLTKGKRKSVKTVLKRFYRLNWGIWIRTKAGRHKKNWKKSYARNKRLRQHVFCNSTQSWLLDTMVTKYWRRPRNYVDDPYVPYHTREEFLFTRKKPLP